MTTEQSAQTRHQGPILASDMMTTPVVSVGPDEPTPKIASLLLQHRISAVPVVNADNMPIGMVSEGDLIGRVEHDRLARIDWWLSLLAGDQAPDDELRTRLQANGRTARDVMAAPLVTVTEATHATEVARLLGTFHIKRVPVLRGGRIVGIVSRADLLRAMASAQTDQVESESSGRGGFLHSLFGEYHRPAWEVASIASPHEAQATHDETQLAASDFRHMVDDFQHSEAHERDAVRRAAAQQRRQRATDLIDTHVLDEGWRQILHHAREAAEHGQKEHLLLRFPNQLCLDGGRAINTAASDWPVTLRGEAAEIYLRWERELKPQGFTVSAQILEFPGGKPGDVGLFLTWEA